MTQYPLTFLRKYFDDEKPLHGRLYALYLLFIFCAGSVVGWIYEELLFLVLFHQETKRGFLFGPYLPIYGTGAVLMLALLRRWRKKPWILLPASMLVAGVLEYSTGALMMNIWHRRWWDYTGQFLNIQGYVSLESVCAFGAMALLLFYVLDPLANHFVTTRKGRALSIATCTFGAIMLIDLIATLLLHNKV